MECAFGHLHGYSASYYTYMWSLVIAKDFFGAFDGDLMDVERARRYRAAVLGAGRGAGRQTTSCQGLPGAPRGLRRLGGVAGQRGVRTSLADRYDLGPVMEDQRSHGNGHVPEAGAKPPRSGIFPASTLAKPRKVGRPIAEDPQGDGVRVVQIALPSEPSAGSAALRESP